MLRVLAGRDARMYDHEGRIAGFDRLSQGLDLCLMNDEAFDYPRAYRLSRLGFLLMAVGLVPCCILEVATLAGALCNPRLVRWIEHSGVKVILDTTTPWVTLAGSTILWTAWETTTWRRRAGLLMTMCLVDVACWFINLGDPNNLGEYAYFRDQFQSAMGWAQFALIASLSGDLLGHLGVEEAEESSKSTQSLASTGAVIWMLLFLETTNLRAGWPLQKAPAIGFHTWILALGSFVIRTICLLQVTALVLAAVQRLNDVDGSDDETTRPRGGDGSSPDGEFGLFEVVGARDGR